MFIADEGIFYQKQNGHLRQKKILWLNEFDCLKIVMGEYLHLKRAKCEPIIVILLQ